MEKINKKKIYEIQNIDELNKVAQEILTYTSEFKIICFYGSMGSGKTTLIKKICKEAKVVDYVNSPTFSIVNEYQTELDKIIYHFDFYRIDKLQQAKDIGIEEYFDSNNICLIEWPEKIEPLLPHSILKINIEMIENDSRKIIIRLLKKEN